MEKKKEEIKYIGVSSESPHVRRIVSELISTRIGYRQDSFERVIYDFMNRLTGCKSVTPNDPEMEAFLGKEWSYVRDEKFNEAGVIVIKPVRYYLTPKQIFTRLKYEMRLIHSDIWVNAYFNRSGEHAVLQVHYPNEADGIIGRGGIVIRVNHNLNSQPVRNEDKIMNGYKCSYTIDYDDEEQLHQKLEKLLCHIESKNPNAFTGE